MSWILITIIAYFILAIVNLADKFLLTKVLDNPKAYTFLVGLLGLLVFVLAPWFLYWPGVNLFLGNIFAGSLFPLALILLYKALKLGEVSRIITLIGASVPIFTIVLSIILLQESFNFGQWVSIFFLLLGTIIISYLPEGKTVWDSFIHILGFDKRKRFISIIIALSASFIFAIFFISTKYLYNNQEFLSAFIWIRLGTFLSVLLLLIKEDNRKKIFKSLRGLKGWKRGVFLSNQGLAGIGFLLQNYAISLGSVALVNALQGVQYVFILIFGSIISIIYPKIIKEKISKIIIIQKGIAIILISIGLYYIANV